MTELLLIKLLHVVGFAYWLGGDLGVFYSSYYVADSQQPRDVRVATAKILFALDQAPRICMTMMLPLGTHLAWRLGALPINVSMIAAIWVLSFAWLAMVIILHLAKPGRGKSLLTTFDFFFRLTLASGLIAIGALALLSENTGIPYWVAVKLIIFGGLIGCGLLVRIKLKPFGPAFARLAGGTADAADDAAIQNSLSATRPFVVTIWIGLLASAALGLHLI